MDGTPAIYLGKIVDKKHFRAFIYNINGDKKLVDSWDEYENHMESGLWFSTQEDAKACVPVEKPKRVRNKPVPVKAQELKEQDDEPLIEEELIKDDDFLPQAGK